MRIVELESKQDEAGGDATQDPGKPGETVHEEASKAPAPIIPEASHSLCVRELEEQKEAKVRR